MLKCVRGAVCRDFLDTKAGHGSLATRRPCARLRQRSWARGPVRRRSNGARAHTLDSQWFYRNNLQRYLGVDGSLWSQMANFGPPARCDHVLVYDAARQQVLLFGGLSSQLPVADTWAWNGEDWTQLSDSGPPARSRHAAAYDSARQRVVLFGGQRTDPTAGLIMLGDTWEWDGQDWTQVSETGPSPRQLAVMAFDSARNKTVLFGGTNMFMDVSTGDTWEWDGAAWTRAADFGPPVGSGGAMVYAGNECVAFGGTNLPSVDAQPVFYPTTWGWDGSHWVLRQDMGPGPRWRHGMAFDGQRGTIVMFADCSWPPFGATAAGIWATLGSITVQLAPRASSRYRVCNSAPRR